VGAGVSLWGTSMGYLYGDISMGCPYGVSSTTKARMLSACRAAHKKSEPAYKRRGRCPSIT